VLKAREYADHLHRLSETYVGVSVASSSMEPATTQSLDTNGPASGFFAQRPTLAFCALIAVNAMWAFQFAGARIATRELGAVLVTLVPLAVATLLVVPFAGLNGDLFQVKNRPALIDVLLIGTLGVVPAQLGLVLGVERTLASNASVLSLTIPVLTALSASVFLRERMTRLRWVSFAIAILGVCLISTKDIQQARLFSVKYIIGNLLVLASCAGSAFNNSYSRRVLSRLSPAQVLVWTFIVADLELLVLGVVTDWRGWTRLRNLQFDVWWSLILIAIFSLGVSMLLYFAVIQSVEVMRATLSVYLLPVFGLLFSAILLREKLTPNLIAGGILIFISCFLVTVYEEKQRLRGMHNNAKA
jgi:drug/metabolite transporter (DMT)-like permease